MITGYSVLAKKNTQPSIMADYVVALLYDNPGDLNPKKSLHCVSFIQTVGDFVAIVAGEKEKAVKYYIHVQDILNVSWGCLGCAGYF